MATRPVHRIREGGQRVVKLFGLYITKVAPADLDTAAALEHASVVAWEWLTGAEASEIAARMARSEVKNYLAELAEENDLPFGSAAGFLRGIRSALAGMSVANLPADNDEPADRGAEPDDGPFTVIDLPGSPLRLAGSPVEGLMSLKCATYGDRLHTPCTNEIDDGSGRQCACWCHLPRRTPGFHNSVRGIVPPKTGGPFDLSGLPDYVAGSDAWFARHGVPEGDQPTTSAEAPADWVEQIAPMPTEGPEHALHRTHRAERYELANRLV